uniref:Phosphatidylinositol-specific phospholipase C X domain-containing protein n=1 Tax=Anabas testudineus TaxID=64144 RepID=A0A3Q1H7U8_ANATE
MGADLNFYYFYVFVEIQMSANGKGKRGVTRYSDWMMQLPPELHNIPLFNLAIPGSHDSMSYDLDSSSSIIEPDSLKKFSRLCCVRKTLLKWAATQEDTITKQLDAGVRYFDLRIARKPHDTNPTRLYFYHGLYTRTDVESVLKMINDWAERHPREIIILALSHFKGFDQKTELHNHLISFIKTLFGPKVVLRGVTPTLRSCWDQGTNVIVSYDYPAIHDSYMWSKISYFYGDSMKIARVESVLSEHHYFARHPTGFFVCGLNLTLPDDARICLYVLRLCDSFANVVRRSLPRLLLWVKQQGSRKPNIVASDLAGREDFVSAVIQYNYYLLLSASIPL